MSDHKDVSPVTRGWPHAGTKSQSLMHGFGSLQQDSSIGTVPTKIGFKDPVMSINSSLSHALTVGMQP